MINPMLSNANEGFTPHLESTGSPSNINIVSFEKNGKFKTYIKLHISFLYIDYVVWVLKSIKKFNPIPIYKNFAQKNLFY